MRNTDIIAYYLPSSSAPDYIGTHLSTPPHPDSPQARRYHSLHYMGQGAWINDEGMLVSMPAANRSTPWGRKLALLSAAERQAIRADVLSSHDARHAGRALHAALRLHMPPYNAVIPQTPEAKRAKLAAYQRAYRPGYYAQHPQKLEAKRLRDRERLRAKRQAFKAQAATTAASTPAPQT